MKVKKIIACVTTLSILSPCVITAFAASDSDGINTARQMALENSTITSDAVEYTPFSYEGFEVRLYKEPLLDANEAIEKYPNAYNYISERAQEIGISTSPDSSDFQEYAISFALYEGTDRGLTKEIQDFAGFMDLYENISKNENILATVSSRSASNAELESLMLYGDNVFEKHGINRDRTGDREKTRYLCGKQGIFTRDRALIRPGSIRQLETRASTRSASFFHALGGPGRPYNGGGAAGAYRTRNGAKPLKQGHLRAKRGPLGPSRKSQQQTKRTGFAAHGHSIAETAPEGKRASRANGALIRA